MLNHPNYIKIIFPATRQMENWIENTPSSTLPVPFSSSRHELDTTSPWYNPPLILPNWRTLLFSWCSWKHHYSGQGVFSPKWVNYKKFWSCCKQQNFRGTVCFSQGFFPLEKRVYVSRSWAVHFFKLYPLPTEMWQTWFPFSFNPTTTLSNWLFWAIIIHSKLTQFSNLTPLPINTV